MGMGMVMRMHVCVEDAWEGANPAPPLARAAHLGFCFAFKRPTRRA